ncbi:HpcH/HpaI aldolase family protein [Marinobacter zhanjiangensis]|uniref:2-keto-3-deoxy-L-rhamnonate aldolase n=1 Tax=Marinobacter zhanjiangensis TaxID=578215 RepID=A0ABQ3B4V8_9GAMM|nr:aldolase/citrate lyase family protein [Marinobacter zhanjiangensis]GGY79021.1 2-keto-3-deoxy-L-rhamnonate aldolase [Marinobacter zhanjiangensis]
MTQQSLKQKLKSGPCMGLFSKTTDSAMVEAAGLGGMDFIILDMEHGPATLETMHHHVRAARLGGVAPVIRARGIDAHAIGSALDTGAEGVQVPNINTADQAREAVAAARFHPYGQRGVCRFVRAARFGTQPKDDYFAEANEATLILQVEGTEGVRNLDEILEVEGFDVLFVGPYDLSQSVGKPGQVEAPEVIELIDEIARKAEARGILLGAFSDQLARSRDLIKGGFNYLAHSVDVNVFAEACQRLKGQING